ncbi:gluconate 2-dehydrogenase subunit 3 family protein [Metabacillus halosaccharovorans]|uniref:Uncharacterized protein n=1 Tax=Metabacillus halosaccharovorans TaxID=930124 RepID=A0ABT3DGR9_9BACI|nr:hypothetical protein [Metabacillus halosaccharovorans]MCV9886196.1 hypothetical protein [Metabacillus halosaccharovorans]
MDIEESERRINCYIKSTFQALVQAIIPPTPCLTDTFGVVFHPGALEFKVYKYVILILNHSISYPVKLKINVQSMALSTAELLDHGADQLINTCQNVYPVNIMRFPHGGLFSKLSPIDRLRALTLIDKLEINTNNLKPPYQNNPDLIRQMTAVLNQLTMFGFYSEWTGYGTTSQCPPNQRRVEYFPPGWIMSKYPGPAYAYRDFRGFLAYITHEKEKK